MLFILQTAHQKVCLNIINITTLLCWYLPVHTTTKFMAPTLLSKTVITYFSASMLNVSMWKNLQLIEQALQSVFKGKTQRLATLLKVYSPVAMYAIPSEASWRKPTTFLNLWPSESIRHCINTQSHPRWMSSVYQLTLLYLSAVSWILPVTMGQLCFIYCSIQCSVCTPTPAHHPLQLSLPCKTCHLSNQLATFTICLLVKV